MKQWIETTALPLYSVVDGIKTDGNYFLQKSSTLQRWIDVDDKSCESIHARHAAGTQCGEKTHLTA